MSGSRTRKAMWRCHSAVLAIAVIAAPATARAAGPVPIDIGPKGSALGINDKGQVVGGRGFGGDPAWLWKQGVGLTRLGTAYSANAINDSAMVVGSTYQDYGAFVWTPASGLVELGTLGGERYRLTVANDVNERGEVVGRSRDRLMTSPTDRAVMWTPDGIMADLGSLPGTGSAMATAINDNGQVVGTSGEIGSYSYNGRAFSWTQAGGMIDLGTLPGSEYSHALGINNRGQVVGGTGPFAGSRAGHAFLWTQPGGMVDLGTLPGAGDSEATDINDSGQVVGESGGRPFLWSEATGMTELGVLPDDAHGVAYAINEQGQVVGASRNDSRSHAVLWFGDTTRPTARLAPVGGEKLADVRSRGLRLQLTMSEAGSSEITLRLARTRTTLATKTINVSEAGASAVTFKLDRKVRAGLRKVSKATFTLRTATRDVAGNSTIATTTLTIKR